MSSLPSNPSASFVARNAHLYGTPIKAPSSPVGASKPRKVIRVQKSTEERLNKTEQRFLAHLRAYCNPYARIFIQFFTFRLAADLRYTPDFSVYDGAKWRHYEVKGGWVTDDSKVKIKAAAALLTMDDFTIVYVDNGIWTYQDVPKG